MAAEFATLTVEFFHLDREDNRTVMVDDTHDADQASRVLSALLAAGWSVNEVTISTVWDEDTYDVPNGTIASLADALISDPENVGQIVAYGELFGWHDGSAFETGRWGQRNYEDGFYTYTSDVQEFAEEHVKDIYHEVFADMPDFIADAIDWDAISDAVMADYETFEFESEFYIFHKSW